MEQNQFSADGKDNNIDANITSGSNLSYWLDSEGPIQFEPLKKDLNADVLVIGAGISGITTAYSLAKEGRHVVVVDDGFVGSGETGRTTAHIANALDDFYHEIEKYHGEEGAKYAAESHSTAIDFIERVVREENINCNFTRLNGYLFLHETDKPKTIEDEYAATKKYAIETELLSEVPGIPSESGPCLKYSNQAQFHPLIYLKCLTDAIIRMGGEIYSQSKASQITEGSAKVNGYTISATHIVVATNTPVNDMVTMHTKQFPYRSYVVAFTIPKANREPSLWWDTGDHDSKWITMPYNYVRLQEYNEDEYLLICGGADHKTGQADAEDMPEEKRYAMLEEWASKRFPDVKKVVYRWSGQVMEPIDTMGYIGRNPGDKNIYIVTGDSGNGMTHGTIAGILLPDLIAGRPNAWEKLYDPARITFRATPDYLIENSNTFKQYGDLLSGRDVAKLDEIPAGEGSVISAGLKKYAVYKDESGGVHAYSAYCTHLGCVIHWNSEEKSFDCPCHGSRFSADGKVMNGPAISDLPEVGVEKVAK